MGNQTAEQAQQHITWRTCRYRATSSAELPTFGLRTITLSAGRFTPAASVDCCVASELRLGFRVWGSGFGV